MLWASITVTDEDAKCRGICLEGTKTVCISVRASRYRCVEGVLAGYKPGSSNRTCRFI